MLMNVLPTLALSLPLVLTRSVVMNAPALPTTPEMASLAPLLLPLRPLKLRLQPLLRRQLRQPPIPTSAPWAPILAATTASIPLAHTCALAILVTIYLMEKLAPTSTSVPLEFTLAHQAKSVLIPTVLLPAQSLPRSRQLRLRQLRLKSQLLLRLVLQVCSTGSRTGSHGFGTTIANF